MSVQTYDEENKKAIIEDYKKSGLALKTYAKEIDMPESTLRGWIREDREMSFGAIEVKPSATIPKARNNTMVFVCENIRIELGGGFNKEFFKRIVEVLCNAE